jgi:protein-S-isoprenylcysteine O-methyltransferase Ste14
MIDGVVHQADLWASYIWPAYILTIGGMAALLIWAFTTMHRAESRADQMRAEKRAEGMKKR